MYYKNIYVDSERLDARAISKAQNNCEETIKLLELNRTDFEKVRIICQVMDLDPPYNRAFRDELVYNLKGNGFHFTEAEITESLRYIDTKMEISFYDVFIRPDYQCKLRIDSVASFYKDTPEQNIPIKKENYINKLKQDLLEIAADLDYLKIAEKEEKYSRLKKLTGIKQEKLDNFENEKRELTEELGRNKSLLEEMKKNINEEKAAHLKKHPFLEKTDRNAEM